MLVCYQGVEQYVTLKKNSLQRYVFDNKYEKKPKKKPVQNETENYSEK